MSGKEKINCNLSIEDINNKVNLIYRHNTLVSDYSITPRDYGISYLMSEVEMHTLGYICDHKGITVTQLSIDNYRTKSAVSQLITKLESKGLIERRKKIGNKKTVFLHPTEEGERVFSIHRKYDYEKTLSMLNEILKTCTMEEVEGFYKVIDLRIKIFEKEYQTKLDSK